MKTYFTLFVILLLISCGKIAPAGFWIGYKNGDIKVKEQDNGPWGGYSRFHWVSQEHAFDPKDVQTFAKANGWSLIDSLTVDEFVLLIKSNGKKLDMMDTIQAIRVIRFDTGWLLLGPEPDESTSQNGYVLLSEAGDQMSVYHFWGE